MRHNKHGKHGDADDTMVCDYLYALICDSFRSENIPFITKEDMRHNALNTLFHSITPDLIVKSDPTMGRHKPCIVDIIEKSFDVIEKKKSMYETFGISFDYVVIQQSNYTQILKKFLPECKVGYVYRNCNLFMTERACVDNTSVNDVPMILKTADHFETLQAQFKQALVEYVETILDGRGL